MVIGMKRTPMKRIGFMRKPCAVTGPARCIVPLTRPPNYAASSASAIQAPKQQVTRSESYRRAVAALPCIHCGIEGFSQAAHPNTGKAKGAKADDLLCFPLCADRLGVMGCHAQFDQHQLFKKGERAAVESDWTARTQSQLKQLEKTL